MGIALDQKGLLWSWGKNEVGDLGQGDCEPREHPAPILGLKSQQVAQVACGNQFAIAIGK